jgi:hypothetical protein
MMSPALRADFISELLTHDARNAPTAFWNPSSGRGRINPRAVVSTEPIKSRRVAHSETTPARCGSSSDVGARLDARSAYRQLTCHQGVETDGRALSFPRSLPAQAGEGLLMNWIPAGAFPDCIGAGTTILRLRLRCHRVRLRPTGSPQARGPTTSLATPSQRPSRLRAARSS